MKKMGFRGKFWSIIILISILILLIIGFIYLADDNTDIIEDNDKLDPRTIIDNYEEYIGKNITVKGYFYEPDFGDEFAYISTKPVEEPIRQGEFELGKFLLINYSSVSNMNFTDSIYYFSGRVKEANFSQYALDVIYLDVNSVEKR
jgi:hypothetical protein